GVLPEAFAFPSTETQIYLLMEPDRQTARLGAFNEHAIARLRPGVRVPSAQAELTTVLPRIEGTYRDATAARLAQLGLTPKVVSRKSSLVGETAPVLWTVFGSTALLLAIAFANAATLFAARMRDRRAEMALRSALGAGTRQLARVIASEALLLTLSAAV